MKRLFISDLHLSEASQHHIQALKALLERFADIDELYLLGDIFEAWVGDDDDSDWLTAVNEILRSQAGRGVKVFLTRGNRDFLIGSQWPEANHITLLAEQHVIQAGTQQWLLSHGDEYCTDDVAYQQFKQLSRSPEWQAEMLRKPLAERHAIAAHMRMQSSQANANKQENIMDVNTKTVADAAKTHGADLILHGHTHRPAIHQEANFKRVVLGDWTSTLWYVIANDEHFELVEESVD